MDWTQSIEQLALAQALVTQARENLIVAKATGNAPAKANAKELRKAAKLAEKVAAKIDAAQP
jgi:hypothetical protein